MTSRPALTWLLAAALLTACTAPPPTPDPTAGPTSPPATEPVCPPAGVLLRAGTVDAAMGLRVLSIELVNCGDQPRRLSGYPAVRVLDKDRAALDVRVLSGVAAISGAIARFDKPPRPIVVRPGETAVAIVAWRNTVTDATVPATDAPYLAVAPSAGQPEQTLAPEGGLDLGNTGRIGISAWMVAEASGTAAPTVEASS